MLFLRLKQDCYLQQPHSNSIKDIYFDNNFPETSGLFQERVDVGEDVLTYQLNGAAMEPK